MGGAYQAKSDRRAGTNDRLGSCSGEAIFDSSSHSGPRQGLLTCAPASLNLHSVEKLSHQTTICHLLDTIHRRSLLVHVNVFVELQELVSE
jgi:hypothetical protein